MARKEKFTLPMDYLTMDYLTAGAAKESNRPALTYGHYARAYGRDVMWSADGYMMNMVWDCTFGKETGYVELPKSTDDWFPVDGFGVMDSLKPGGGQVVVKGDALRHALKHLVKAANTDDDHHYNGFLMIGNVVLGVRQLVIGTDRFAASLDIVTTDLEPGATYYVDMRLLDRAMILHSDEIEMVFDPDVKYPPPLFVQHWRYGHETEFCSLVMPLGNKSHDPRRIISAIGTVVEKGDKSLEF